MQVGYVDQIIDAFTHLVAAALGDFQMFSLRIGYGIGRSFKYHREVSQSRCYGRFELVRQPVIETLDLCVPAQQLPVSVLQVAAMFLERFLQFVLGDCVGNDPLEAVT